MHREVVMLQRSKHVYICRLKKGLVSINIQIVPLDAPIALISTHTLSKSVPFKRQRHRSLKNPFRSSLQRGTTSWLPQCWQFSHLRVDNWQGTKARRQHNHHRVGQGNLNHLVLSDTDSLWQSTASLNQSVPFKRNYQKQTKKRCIKIARWLL